ncbi:hypothetical protein R50072_00230 [Simiduia litorea]|uniref:hypothetical protein n=1 Tax=Simiduia litorea TaxID=1435348 RepID=UPI0036F1AF45
MLFHRQKSDLNGWPEQLPTAEELTRIRDIVATAIAQERSEGIFLRVVTANFGKLHNAIAFLGNDGKPNACPEALLEFVMSYIRHVPDFIDAVNKIGKEHNIQDVTTPFLRIAQDFFLSPPELIDGHTGIAALLDEAYLAHRIIEEVNDHICARFGIPLAPMDMTKANLIVHSLIGEPFANDLDHAVQYSIEMLLMRGSTVDRLLTSDAFQRYVGKHQLSGWDVEIAQHPCLINDLCIDLKFAQKSDASHLH